MIELPKLGLGCAPLGGLLSGVSSDDAAAVLDTALDSGVRYFDTAPYYGFGLSERRVGDAIRGRPDVILSTKVGRLLKPGLPADPAAFGWPEPLPFHPVFDYGYDGVMRSFEDSLQRLGRDRIDILLLHDIGPFTHTDPDEERRHFRDAMSGGYRALDELRRAGQREGHRHRRQRGRRLAPRAGARRLGRLPSCRALHASGADASREAVPGMRAARDADHRRRPLQQRHPRGRHDVELRRCAGGAVARVRRIRAVCDRHGVPLPAAALQFCLAHPLVDTVIPGARTRQELLQTLEWMETAIPDALWQDLKRDGLLAADAPTMTPRTGKSTFCGRRQASRGAKLTRSRLLGSAQGRCHNAHRTSA